MTVMIVMMIVCAIIAVLVAYPILTLIAIIAVIVFIFYRIISDIGPDIQGTTNSTEKRKPMYETEFYKDLTNELHSIIKHHILTEVQNNVKNNLYIEQTTTQEQLNFVMGKFESINCDSTGVSIRFSEYSGICDIRIKFDLLGYRTLTDSQVKELKSALANSSYLDLVTDSYGNTRLKLDRYYWKRYLFSSVDTIVKQAIVDYKSKYKPIQ